MQIFFNLRNTESELECPNTGKFYLCHDCAIPKEVTDMDTDKNFDLDQVRVPMVPVVYSDRTRRTFGLATIMMVPYEMYSFPFQFPAVSFPSFLPSCIPSFQPSY